MTRGWPITLAVVLLLLHLTAVAGFAAQTLRLGYLDHPGSILCVAAAAKGLFRGEGVRLRLIRYRDTESGLADLAAGRIDAGAFAVGETLRQIADGRGLRIIAGGGSAAPAGPLADLDEAGRPEQESGGLVVAVADGSRAPAKEVLVSLVTALIRAHQALQKAPEAVRARAAGQISSPATVHVEPSADYRRMERLWRARGLQREGMARDFLANHLYEEIYCDALDRLVDREGLKDELLRKLFSEAVCVPDCCPNKEKKSLTLKGGSQ